MPATVNELHPKLAEIRDRAAGVLAASTDPDARQLADDAQWLITAAENTRTKYRQYIGELADENAQLRQRVAVADEEAAVRAFNDAHPIGTPVRYWTGEREGDGKVSQTRTQASLLGGHTAVVWVYTESSCIALTHVEPIAQTAGVA